MRTVWWEDGSVRLIDQLRLPQEVVVCRLPHGRRGGEAIRSMKLRGAPAIGVAAAYGVALAARTAARTRPEALLADDRGGRRRRCAPRGRPR